MSQSSSVVQHLHAERQAWPARQAAFAAFRADAAIDVSAGNAPGASACYRRTCAVQEQSASTFLPARPRHVICSAGATPLMTRCCDDPPPGISTTRPADPTATGLPTTPPSPSGSRRVMPQKDGVKATRLIALLHPDPVFCTAAGIGKGIK